MESIIGIDIREQVERNYISGMNLIVITVVLWYWNIYITYGGKELSQARAILNNICTLEYTNRGLKDVSGFYVLKDTYVYRMLFLW